MMDQELIEGFVIESRDLLDEVEPSLIELQQNSDSSGDLDRDTLDRIFRLFHSMKGSAGFLGLDTVSSITHEAETLLDMVRKGKLSLNKAYTNLLCETIDFSRKLLDVIDESFSDAGLEEEAEGLVGKLAAAIKGEISSGSPEPAINLEESGQAFGSGSQTDTVKNLPEGSTEQFTDFDIPITKEMIDHFMRESDDLLDLAESALLGCGTDPSSSGEMLNEAFRALHSLKGNAGIMGLLDLQNLAHRMEEALEGMVAGTVEADDGNLSVLLNVIDVLRSAVSEAQKEKHSIHGCDAIIELIGEMIPPPQETSEVSEKVQSSSATTSQSEDLQESRSKQGTNAAPGEESKSEGEEGGPAANRPRILVVDDEADVVDFVMSALKDQYSCTGVSSPDEALEIVKESGSSLSLLLTDMKMPKMDGNDLISTVRKVQPSLAIMVMTGYGDKDMLIKLVDQGIEAFIAKPFPVPALLEKVAEALEKGKRLKQPKRVPAVSKGPSKSVSRNDIRVDIQKLDTLINLVGELVISEAMVTRSPLVAEIEDENYERAVHQLRRVTSSLQDIAMSVRMIPLAATFRKMIRLVHDVSAKAQKKVSLNLVGEETEVDKTVIEKIADPLVHIVRNSVDHGVEPPEERKKAGKPEEGNLVIEGRHEGGEVWILITDDGRGLDKEKILKKGIERGLVQGDGSDLTEAQIHKLVFEPGFSTADQVTDISGRGVGMDVVKRNIENLNGRIDVHSKPGEGTTVILRIPLTLAIIEGMLVRVGDAQYTIPMLSIRESLRPEPSSITRTPDNREVVRVRDEMIPVLRLHEVFKREPDVRDLSEGILVIVETEDVTFSLFVDEIVGQQETVIKGLSEFLGTARGTSGCTILGNGEVSLILDVSSLMEMISTDE